MSFSTSFQWKIENSYIILAGSTETIQSSSVSDAPRKKCSQQTCDLRPHSLECCKIIFLLFHCYHPPYCISPGSPLLRVACTVVVGKAGVVSVVSTTSGDASPPSLRPTLRPSPAPHVGSSSATAVSTGALPLQLPSPPLQTGQLQSPPDHRAESSPSKRKRRTDACQIRTRRGRYVAFAIANCRPRCHRHPLLRCHSGRSHQVSSPPLKFDFDFREIPSRLQSRPAHSSVNISRIEMVNYSGISRSE